MGAFFLYKKNSNIDLDSVKKIFLEKGFKNPNIFDFKSYTLLLYKKILLNEKNYFIEGNNAIYTIGTVVYKGKNYKQSIISIFHDFIENKLNPDELIGSFCIIIKFSDEIKYFIDRAGVQNIYYNENQTVISSSFLAVIYSSKEKMYLNKSAALEVLATGCLIGPDTLIKEISRLEISNPLNFKSIKFAPLPMNKIPDLSKKEYNKCLKDQIDYLNGYFESIKPFANSFGLIIGITGGFDSRLLLILALRHNKNISCYTSWRKVKDKDITIAEEVCKKTSLKLIIEPAIHPLDMTQDEMLNTLNDAFLFCDGHIRSQSYWTEQYNTRNHREKININKNIGLNGIGGEQYRNNERMVMPKWNFKNWIKYELILKNSGKSFTTKKDLNLLIKYIRNKIEKKLKIQKKYIDHLDVKRYYNEIFNLSNRSTRLNMENQISFYLAPFTEYNVALKAYRIIHQLGVSLKYESDMIKLLNPVLAEIDSRYGFNFLKGEPFWMKSQSFIKEMLPGSLYHYLAEKKKRDKNTFHIQYEKKFPFIKELTEEVIKLNLPLDINILKHTPSGYLIASMGYFLKKLQFKIII